MSFVCSGSSPGTCTIPSFSRVMDNFAGYVVGMLLLSATGGCVQAAVSAAEHGIKAAFVADGSGASL